jgi:hypothetical protein
MAFSSGAAARSRSKSGGLIEVVNLVVGALPGWGYYPRGGSRHNLDHPPNSRPARRCLGRSRAFFERVLSEDGCARRGACPMPMRNRVGEPLAALCRPRWTGLRVICVERRFSDQRALPWERHCCRGSARAAALTLSLPSSDVTRGADDKNLARSDVRRLWHPRLAGIARKPAQAVHSSHRRALNLSVHR